MVFFFNPAFVLEADLSRATLPRRADGPRAYETRYDYAPVFRRVSDRPDERSVSPGTVGERRIAAILSHVLMVGGGGDASGAREKSGGDYRTALSSPAALRSPREITSRRSDAACLTPT